jgi:sodium transport system permease protein
MKDFARLGRLMRKELSEILRDRRTVVTLVLMPLLLYPLLSVAFQQLFLASRLAPQKGVEYVVGFISEEDYQRFGARLAYGDVWLQRQRLRDDKTEDKSEADARIIPQLKPLQELDQALREKRMDLIVKRAPPPVFGTNPRKTLGAGAGIRFEAIFLPSTPGAHGALEFIERRLAAANEREIFELMKKGRPTNMVLVTRTPLEEPAPSSMISLASLVPLILILMTITGAVYPAIDLTAGERERGTLEILVAAPVPRLGLLFAKYVSVVTVAIMTALVNLIAMTATLLFSGLGPVLFGGQGISFLTIIELFGLLLLFAAFFSAVLLSITSFARSFKEAQAYLIPVMLVSMTPGVMGMMPGLKLADWCWTPLLNIVLLGRDLFEAKAEWLPVIVVVVSTGVYALAALFLAARIFGAESVLFSEQSGWADLFRRPAESQAHASLSAALWCLALMIPVNFMLQGTALLLKQSGLADDRSLLVIALLKSVILFVALPGLFAWRGRVAMRSGFGLNLAPAPAYPGAILLGLCLWPVVLTGLLWLPEVSEERRRIFEQVAELLGKQPPVLRVVLVVIPALLEEWFFRGYLYGALRQRLNGPTTILVNALLFGVFHFVLNIDLGWQRILPSALMGIPLSLVREATGSILPGMLLHACYNASLALLQDVVGPSTTIEPWWVVAGMTGSAIGAALVWWGRRPEVLPEEARIGMAGASAKK